METEDISTFISRQFTSNVMTTFSSALSLAGSRLGTFAEKLFIKKIEHLVMQPSALTSQKI